MSLSGLKRRVKRAIKWVAPPVLLLPFREAPLTPPGRAPSWHQGDYQSWDEAVAAAKGYQAANILEIQRAAMRKVRDGKAVYERDSVLFDEIEYFFPTLAALLLVASRNGNRLSVLDFGGALGSTYYQNRHMLSHLGELTWHVVEQPHFVEAGRAEFRNGQLDFHPDIDAAWAVRTPDVVVLSSVLQYLGDPFSLLRQIADRDPPYILVDRTPVLDEGRERIVVQTVPPSIYPATYACRLFAPGAIEAALQDRYEPRFHFEVHAGTTIDVDQSRARYRGIFFERRKNR
jgi:putative methyltransferase (TIGR04325 family)